MSNIANFKSQFQGGVRPNQFRVFMVKGPNGIGTKNFEFLGKAASIPASTIGNVDVPYRGRQLKVPGDRTFEDWTLTVFNDGQWSSRSYFERWMQVLQGHRNPVRSVNATDVYGTARVQQLSRSGGVIATYTMEDIYPTNTAAIDLGFDTNDSVEEFQVTFAVNNWYSSASPEPSGQGSNLDVDFQVSGNIGGVGVSVGTGGISINA
jgi:hypothetical protein